MNKPLPWNVKGVGFDAREAARLAAKRAGVPLGEWLNGVISARAAELGVQVEDVEADDRLEAIATRLSENDRDTAAATGGHEPPARRDEDPFLGRPSLRTTPSREARDTTHDAMPARMASPPPRGSVFPATQGTPLAVQARFGGSPSPVAEPVMASDSAMPQRIAARSQADVPAARAAPVPASEGDRLDDRLNAILAKLNRSFEAAAEASETLGGRENAARPSVREADPAPVPRAPAPRSADKAVAVEPVTSEIREPLKTEASRSASFADLQGAFRSLAEKLEAQLAEEKDDRRSRPGSTAVRSEPGRAARMQGRAETAQRVEEIKTLQRELAQLAADVAELTPHRHLASLEAAVRDLVGRTDLSRLDGVQESVLAPVERLGQEMRDAIRATDATAAVEAVRRDMKALATKLNAQPAASGDTQALEGLRGELRGLRDMVGTLADRLAASERLGDEIAALGNRVAAITDRGSAALSRELTQAIGDIRESLQAFQPHAGLGVIDRKIDHLSARIETMAGARSPDAYFTDVMRQIDQAHEALADRLAGRTAPREDLSGIEESLGTLSAKIDSMGRSSQDVNALYGLVGNLADRMQDARDPRADAPAFTALQAQIGQLVERLDRTETDNVTLHGLERLIGDLFLQIEQSRNVAIDAAENAARAAAQDTLRAAMDNPSLNGAELTVQTGLDVDHVSQELAELRRIQETADRRITTTLTALNSTLERLVDHMVAAPASAPAATAVPQSAEPQPAETISRRRRRALPDSIATEAAVASELPPFDPEQFLIEPGSLEMRTRSKGVPARDHDVPSAAPVPHIGADANASVAPLIAAARRAAQAAQDSALEASLKPGADGADPAASGQASKARSFFANRRRPLLLALAGVVLLLGTLQIVRLSTEQPVGEAVRAPAAAEPSAVETPAPAAPKSDKGAALTPAPAVPDAVSPLPMKVAEATDPAPTGSLPPTVPAAELVPLAGLGQGLKDLAAGGDAGAQFEVASRLADGRGVTRDAKASASWFERAAKQGLAPAQYRLGSVYEKGVGVTADPALAVAWYEKAAGQGNIRAMHNLAVMSAEGAGAKPDYGKAVSWFTKAASYGVRDSQYNLAVLFARGLGVPQNLGQSYAWFALAAQQGDTDAVAKRDTVAAKLDAKALADAKAMVASFHPLAANGAANDVAAPAGGWDAALPAKTAATHKVEARVSRM